MRTGHFKTDIRIVNLYPTKGTRWVVYNIQNYFDSYGCSRLKNYLNLIRNGIDIVVNPNEKYQELVFYCAAYFLYSINILFDKSFGKIGKSVFSIVYHQTIS